MKNNTLFDTGEEFEATKFDSELMSQILKDINHKPGSLASFVILFYGYVSSPFKYMNENGETDSITLIELTILMWIIENPGTTTTELSKRWQRTKGAISQIIKKLSEKELIYRIKSDTDAKMQLIYPTDNGIKLSEIYYKKDRYDTPRILNSLLEKCTKDEIRSFYKVVDIYSEIIINLSQNLRLGDIKNSL